jgi:hypothetical protein
VSTQPQPGTSEDPAPLRPVRPLSLVTARGGGSGTSPVLRIIAAAFIVVLVIAAYVYFNEKPPPVIGEILHLTTYPVHRESKKNQFATQSIAPVENTFDEIIVIADVRLHNRSEGPVFLSDMSALLKLPGEEDRSLAANIADFNRAFVAYPALAPRKQQPLLRDTTIPPGATVEGQLIFNYPIPKDQWDKRQSLDLTLSFTHQKDLVLPAPQ